MTCSGTIGFETGVDNGKIREWNPNVEVTACGKADAAEPGFSEVRTAIPTEGLQWSSKWRSSVCTRYAFYIFGSAESSYRTLTTPDTAHAYGLRCTPFLPPLSSPLDDQITTVLDLVGGNFLTL